MAEARELAADILNLKPSGDVDAEEEASGRGTDSGESESVEEAVTEEAERSTSPE